MVAVLLVHRHSFLCPVLLRPMELMLSAKAKGALRGVSMHIYIERHSGYMESYSDLEG